jgi:DNA polymerase elongation subunit (family B)
MVKICEVEFTDFGSQVSIWTRNKNNSLEKRAKRFKHYYYLSDEHGDYKTLYGDSVRKREVNKFWELKNEIKTRDPKDVYEGDLSYIKRFQIDHLDKYESPGKPRIMFYDIETTGFMSEHMPIISIVAYDSYTEEYTSFLWGIGAEYKYERDMLEAFIKYVNRTDPDIITGWNSDRFDYPYI